MQLYGTLLFQRSAFFFLFVWMSIVLYIGLSFVYAPPIAPLAHPMHLLEMPILRCFWKCLKSYRLVMHPTAPSPSFLCTPDAPNLIADRQSESACIYGSRKIDLIVTKSVSRFARNTVDSLTTVRKLKEKSVEVYFEKENIYTLDSKGELFITIMSSLAQEKSRSISENVTWGQRKRMADGKVTMPYRRFLGYRKGEDGLPEIAPEEAEVVRLIYKSFMEGLSYYKIAQLLMSRNIPAPAGGEKWHIRTVESILTNEKYKGSALLQKKFTVDFLTKKQKVNEGEVPQS